MQVLEAVERRELQRVMFFAPPRHGKSEHVARLFPAWYLGRHPRDQFILASYAAKLAESHSTAVRNYIGDWRYPFATRVNPLSRAADAWATVQGGGMRAVGVGGGLTGFGGNVIAVDDPFSGPKEAESETQRENVWRWWQEVVWTRRAPGAAVILMQTRWHEDDLAGRLLNSAQAQDWTVVSMPALAGPNDELGRAEGEPLWPEVFPLEELPRAGIEISTRAHAALYQQQPSPSEGALFLRSQIGRYTSLPPDRRDADGELIPTPWRVVQTLDSSWDEGVGHDYSVIATWGTDGLDRYLIDVWRERVEYPDLRNKAIENFHGQRWRPRALYVEDAANGRPLIQDLKRLRIPVIGIKPEGSKIARADAVTPAFAAGTVYVPRQGEWVEAWIEEHVAFPLGTYDDQVDTTSMALKVLMEGGAEIRELEVKAASADVLAGRNLSERRRALLEEMLRRETGMPRLR